MVMKFSSSVPAAGIPVLNPVCWSPNPLTEVCTVKERVAEGAKLLSKPRNDFKITFPCTSFQIATRKHFLRCCRTVWSVAQKALASLTQTKCALAPFLSEFCNPKAEFALEKVIRWLVVAWDSGTKLLCWSCVGNFMYFRNKSRNSCI